MNLSSFCNVYIMHIDLLLLTQLFQFSQDGRQLGTDPALIGITVQCTCHKQT